LIRSPLIQVEVHEALCCIKSVQGASMTDPYIAGYANELTYTMDIYTDLGHEKDRAGITPVGQRWPQPFMVRAPQPETPEAWCRGFVYGIDLFVFVNEIPDWGPCGDKQPEPGGGTDTIPGIPDVDVPNPGIIWLNRPSSLTTRLLMTSTRAELSALKRALEAVDG